MDFWSRDLARTRDRRGEQLNGKDPVMVSQHPEKFHSHRHCGSEDTMVLVCHMILKENMIKGSSDFLGRSPSN